MPDTPASVTKFGNGGTRTLRQNKSAVVMSRSAGEYITYKIDARGAAASFGFSNTYRKIKQADEFPGHPQSPYEWTLRDGDLPDNDETYTVALGFTAAVEYTLLVQHHRSDGTVIETHKDMDLASTDPNDMYFDPLRVFLV